MATKRKPATDQPAEGSLRTAVLARGVFLKKERGWVGSLSAEDLRDVILLVEDYHAGATPFPSLGAMARAVREELLNRGIKGLPKEKQVRNWLTAQLQQVTGGPT